MRDWQCVDEKEGDGAKGKFIYIPRSLRAHKDVALRFLRLPAAQHNTDPVSFQKTGKTAAIILVF